MRKQLSVVGAKLRIPMRTAWLPNLKSSSLFKTYLSVGRDGFSFFIGGQMKRILLSISFVWTVMASLLLGQVAQAYQDVKVEGGQLVADFDHDGLYHPYFIKGVDYSPYPIGRYPSDLGWPDVKDPRPDNILDDPAILERDFKYLQAMHANTIRIVKGDDTSMVVKAGEPARFPVKLTQYTLDMAKKNGLKVIAGFAVDNEKVLDWNLNSNNPKYSVPIDFTNEDVKKDIRTRFEKYVRSFTDTSAILMWALADGNNLYITDPKQLKAFYSLMNELAGIAHTVETQSDSVHPVALINFEVGNLDQVALGTDDVSMSNIDIWGMNAMRGISFGNLFDDYKKFSKKPLWFATFGTDGWNTTNLSNPKQGNEDSKTQANWDTHLWDEIAAHKDVTIGGTIAEYSDEWWRGADPDCIQKDKQNEKCALQHDYSGFGPKELGCDIKNPSVCVGSPDYFINLEWFGLMSVELNPVKYGADILKPRQAYTDLQGKFALEKIEGTILDKTAQNSASGLKEVDVTIEDDNGEILQTVKTDANGHYESSLLKHGKYYVRPVLPHYAFYQNGKTVEYSEVEYKVDQSFGHVDFTAIQTQQMIQGQVLDVGLNANLGLSNVFISVTSIEGALLETVLTDSQGHFKTSYFNHGSYMVRPQLRHYSFYQDGKAISALNVVLKAGELSKPIYLEAAQTQYQVEGNVVDITDLRKTVNLAHVKVNIMSNGRRVDIARTDDQGHFKSIYLSVGNYTFVPELGKYKFYPKKQDVNIARGIKPKAMNFQADQLVAALSGYVLENGSGKPIVGAKVTVRGKRHADGKNIVMRVLTDQNGYFKIYNLTEPKKLYRVIAKYQKGTTRYKFPKIKITNLASPLTIEGVLNKEKKPATAGDLDIMGTITSNDEESNAGLSDVQVVLKEKKGNRVVLITRSDDDGFFTFENLLPGEYIVEASAKGFQYDPVAPITLVDDIDSLEIHRK